MRPFATTLFLLTFHVTLLAQKEPSLQRSLEINYRSSSEENMLLFQGKQFYGYDPAIEGQPFLEDDQWIEATLVYRGKAYHNIGSRFDLVSQNLIVNHSGLPGPIQLEPLWLEKFTINGRLFKYLQPQHKDLPAGYYEIVQKGKVSAYVFRKKIINKNPTPDGLKKWYSSEDQYIVQFNNAYYPISKRVDLFRLFPDYKKELKRHWKSKGLKFRKQPERAFLVAIQFLNKQSNS